MQKYVHFPFVGQFSVKPHTCSMQKSRCVEHSPALVSYPALVYVFQDY